MVKMSPDEMIAAERRDAASSMRRSNSVPRWGLDEMVCRIGGEHVFLRRAVDDEGEVPDPVVPKRRDAIVPAACVRITMPEKRICRSGGASERCSGSNHKAPRSNF
jgi:hypothetical protein